MKLSEPVTNIPTVGSSTASLLRKLGIETVGDLIEHYPSRYDDYSLISSIGSLQPGERVTVVGTVTKFQQLTSPRRRLAIQKVTLDDQTGTLQLVWFNQPFLERSLKAGTQVSVAGSVELEGARLIMKNPEYEPVRGYSSTISDQRPIFIHTGRIVPVYPETKGLSSKWIRSKIALLIGKISWAQRPLNVLPEVADWLPPEMIQREGLVPLTQALANIHFPATKDAVASARLRLQFDELLLHQLAGQYRKKQYQNTRKALPIAGEGTIVDRFIKTLPFSLTQDQLRAIDDILSDIGSSRPMNRLLQGDVGSGKTVVAAAVAVAVISQKLQVALMVPTQVLADQHTETLTKLLKPFGVKISLLTGTRKNKISEHSENSESQNVGKPDNQNAGTSGSPTLRSSELSGIPSFPNDKPDLIIGTQALIHRRASKFIDKQRLGLVIFDEQHRFGVAQRALLVKRGLSPHVLSMTATPIPRTVALTLYGDLDMTVMRTLPTGRLPVKTWVVPEKKRDSAYRWIKEQIRAGSQAFVICPLIEESEHESLQSLKAVTVEFRKLKQLFSEFSLALLHGKLSSIQKNTVLSQMKQGSVDLLVATPVVEVGLDLPGATLIVIEGAERFGLAQLHQLRGRVGRGNRQSHCLLFTQHQGEYERLRSMETVHDGLALSELDLKWRGPGDLYATRQHGWPVFAIADLSDTSLVQRTFTIALSLVNQLNRLPTVKAKLRPLLDKPVAPN